MLGGAGLAAALADELDELILKISPLMLGVGIPLFAERIGPRAVTMTQHRCIPTASRSSATAGPRSTSLRLIEPGSPPKMTASPRQASLS